MNNKYHAELHLACTPCLIKSCSSGFFFCSSIHYKSLQNFFRTNLIQQRLLERLYAPYTIPRTPISSKVSIRLTWNRNIKQTETVLKKGTSHSILHNNSCLQKKTLPHSSYKNMKTKNTLQLFKLLYVK